MFSISTLLTRNLHDAFGENNPARRRAAKWQLVTARSFGPSVKTLHDFLAPALRDSMDPPPGTEKASAFRQNGAFESRGSGSR
jgi:hypothetical protein